MYVYPMKTKKNVSTKGGGKKDGKIVPFIPIQTVTNKLNTTHKLFRIF